MVEGLDQAALVDDDDGVDDIGDQQAHVALALMGFALGQCAGGDVADETVVPLHPAIGVAQRASVLLHPERFTAGVDQSVGALERVRAIVFQTRAVFRMNQYWRVPGATKSLAG